MHDVSTDVTFLLKKNILQSVLDINWQSSDFVLVNKIIKIQTNFSKSNNKK